VRRDGIKMVSPILLGAEDNRTIGSKLQRCARKRRQRIVRFVAAVPELASLPAGRIGQPDGPGLRLTWNERQVTLRAAATQKCDLLAVGRPARRKVAVGAGGKIMYAANSAVCIQVQNTNESMVAATRFKRQMPAVRRPLRVLLFAAKLGELPSRLPALPTFYSRHPQVMLGPTPHRPAAIGRELNVFAVFLIAAHIAK